MKRPHIASIVATLLVGLVTACTEPNPIDNYPVALRLDLTFNDKALRTVPSAATYTHYSHPISSAYRAFGFGGVLVVHGVDAKFYAFDLSCPYENRSSVRVEPDSDIIYASAHSAAPNTSSTMAAAFPSRVSGGTASSPTRPRAMGEAP